MNKEKILSVLLGPIVSEKSTLASANNQYVFKVRPDSNKREVKAAVEELFGVTVEGVTTLNVKGKRKIYKGKAGQRVNWKKAVVKVS
jgi:large subunit ribosomal protein L23